MNSFMLIAMFVFAALLQPDPVVALTHPAWVLPVAAIMIFSNTNKNKKEA